MELPTKDEVLNLIRNTSITIQPGSTVRKDISYACNTADPTLYGLPSDVYKWGWYFYIRGDIICEIYIPDFPYSYGGIYFRQKWNSSSRWSHITGGVETSPRWSKSIKKIYLSSHQRIGGGLWSL